MKKILITTESLIIGGIETSLISLINFLNTTNCEIDIYVLDKGELYEELSKNNKINIIPIKIPKNKLIYRINKNLFTKRIISKFSNNSKEYDVAIAYYGINNYCDLYAACSNAKKKFIWVHNNYEDLANNSKFKLIYKIKNKTMSSKFKYFDHIVAVSESARSSFNKLFPKYTNKTLVINNLFDMKRLDNVYEECSYKIDQNNYNIMYTGRLVKIKNVSVLIDEFLKVKEVIKKSHLYIIGDGPERMKLEKKVTNLNMDDCIHFLGYQTNPYKYMIMASVLVSASLSETYSLNLYEALALKKYFVSSDNKGACDLFNYINCKNKQNGVICKPNEIHKELINYYKNKNKIHPDFDINESNNKIKDTIIKGIIN